MKTTITKRADELVALDILPANVAYLRRMVVHVGPSESMPGHVAIRVLAIDLPEPILDTWVVMPSRHVEIEVSKPILTPAQQHADLLEQIARSMVSGDQTLPALQILARQTLAMIDPPVMPTHAELLAAIDNAAPVLEQLAAMRDDRRVGPLLDLLHKARRAGGME